MSASFGNALADGIKGTGTPGAAAEDRNLQYILKQLKINLNPFFSGFVAKVDTEDGRCAGVFNLFQGQDLF